MKFKGTQGKLERKYVGSICIGIGTTGLLSKITANSILPETDGEYEDEKEEIEANMLLYSKSPELLSDLNDLVWLIKNGATIEELEERILTSEKLIKQATEL
jgi:hypothetical protein